MSPFQRSLTGPARAWSRPGGRSARRRAARWAGVFAIALTATTGASAQSTTELKRMSLEDLMQVEVSTVSRMPEPSANVPAAHTVITQDDIRRSGATSLPEVLRLAPGVHVARQDGARYAVGIRGFTDRLSRAMLVLIDGRPVYSPLFAGTYWEVQDVMLEDVDRIEIIRGPGGTLWGANAVNGVISIVTRSAAASQGVLVTAAAGTTMQGPVAFRYGGAVGETFRYRAFVTGVDRDPMYRGAGSQFDEWRMVRGGGRGDWELSGDRRLTVQGEAYTARLGSRVTAPLVQPPFAATSTLSAPLGGGHLLGRWSAPLRGGRFQAQAFYDRTRRDERPVGETRHTGDLDLQYQRQHGRHRLIGGAGLRVTQGRITAVAPTGFTPPTRTDHLVTVFGHDDIQLVPDRLQVGVGVKGEHNAYSGFEVQPSARVLWTLNAANRITASVTRAVRTPSRVETDYTTTSLANPATPAFVRLLPNPGFVPEKLVASELGYRVQPWPTLYATASAFANHLDDVLSTELLTAFVDATPPPARLILPVTFDNGLHGSSYGVETTVDWRTTSWWRTTAGYSYLRIALTRDPGGADVSQERRNEGLTPRHQTQVGMAFDAGRSVQLDWMWRYVSRLPAGPVPGYATSNLRIGWQLGRGLELAVVGQDLHAPRHVEWLAGADTTTPVRRSGYVSLTWRQ
jgi:iron complex outermembrane receptor protein